MPKQQNRDDFGPDFSAATNSAGVTALTDLEVQEVSLVDRPANQRKFLLVKSVMAKLGALLGPATKADRPEQGNSPAWPSDMADSAIDEALEQLDDLLGGDESFGADVGSKPVWPDTISVSKRGLTRTLAPLQAAVAAAMGGGVGQRKELIRALERALAILEMDEPDADQSDDEEAA